MKKLLILPILTLFILPLSVQGACLTTANLTGGGCVPYSGATTNVDLGTNSLTAGNLIVPSGGLVDSFAYRITGQASSVLDIYSQSPNILQLMGNNGWEWILSLENLTSDYTVYIPNTTGIMAVIPTTLYGCAQIGIDTMGNIICTSTGGNSQDHQNLFNAWVIFFISMIFTIWFFKRK